MLSKADNVATMDESSTNGSRSCTAVAGSLSTGVLPQENVYVTADYINHPKYVNTLLQQQRRKAN
jgi:hypothetical protein